MPVMPCQRDGKSGFKWGESGFCYLGPTAKAKAARQGAAIHASEMRKDQGLSKLEMLKQRAAIARQFQPKKKLRKKPPRQAEGRGLEAEYYKKILAVIAPYIEEVKTRLIPKLGGIIEQHRAETRLDAYGEVITAAIEDIKLGIAAKIPLSLIKPMVKGQSGAINTFDRAQFNRQIRTVMGIDPIDSDPWTISPTVDSWVEANAALIKNIPDESITRIGTKVRLGVEAGDSLKKMTATVNGELDISKNRAKLIARDQTNKLLGKLTEARQTSIGVTNYIWSTSQDERVRPLHAEREGRVYKWSDPPSDGHPGWPIQCRCRAIPVIEF